MEPLRPCLILVHVIWRHIQPLLHCEGGQGKWSGHWHLPLRIYFLNFSVLARNIEMRRAIGDHVTSHYSINLVSSFCSWSSSLGWLLSYVLAAIALCINRDKLIWLSLRYAASSYRLMDLFKIIYFIKLSSVGVFTDPSPYTVLSWGTAKDYFWEYSPETLIILCFRHVVRKTDLPNRCIPQRRSRKSGHGRQTRLCKWYCSFKIRSCRGRSMPFAHPNTAYYVLFGRSQNCITGGINLEKQSSAIGSTILNRFSCPHWLTENFSSPRVDGVERRARVL